MVVLLLVSRWSRPAPFISNFNNNCTMYLKRFGLVQEWWNDVFLVIILFAAVLFVRQLRGRADIAVAGCPTDIFYCNKHGNTCGGTPKYVGLTAVAKMQTRER